MGRAGKAELLRIRELPRAQAVKTGAGGPPRCDEVAGSPCPIRPIYNKEAFNLSVCGEVVRPLNEAVRADGAPRGL